MGPDGRSVPPDRASDRSVRLSVPGVGTFTAAVMAFVIATTLLRDNTLRVIVALFVLTFIFNLGVAARTQARVPYLLVTHEMSAAYMADGAARSTGRPGVLAIVPGPGVTNALSGLGEALLDSVPVVAALSSRSFRNACWCFSRVKSPSANSRERTKVSA